MRSMRNKILLSTLIGMTQLANSQTVYYSDQRGMPIGSAQTVGNTTYYSNQQGMPMGSAQTAGNATYYSNQFGQPIGTAQAVQQLPVLTSPMPLAAPSFPLPMTMSQ